MRRQPETVGAAFVRAAAGATTCYYPKGSTSFPEVNRFIK